MSGVRNVCEICMGEFIVASRDFSRFVSRQEETFNTFLRQELSSRYQSTTRSVVVQESWTPTHFKITVSVYFLLNVLLDLHDVIEG